MFTVVCTDYNFEDMTPESRIIESQGGRLEAYRKLEESELKRVVAGADAVINQYAAVTAEVVRAMTRARGIVRYGIGVDTIDVPSATKAGIWVANVPDYCIEEVATHALSLSLSLARRVAEADRQVRGGQWDNNALRPMFPLSGKTFGFLGFGRIARTLAALLGGFKMELVAHDPYLSAEAVAQYGAELLPMERVLAESDFVSIHMPLTEETRHRIGAETLRLMKPTAFLVNTSRGPIVDTCALAEALSAGRIAGAALDTVDPEPLPPDHPLLRLQNVIVTPHIAWYSERSRNEVRRRVAEEAVRLARGEPPRCPVNRVET